MDGTNAWHLMRAGIPLSLLLDIDDPALPELGIAATQATRAALFAARAIAPGVDPSAAEELDSALVAPGHAVAVSAGPRGAFRGAAVFDWP